VFTSNLLEKSFTITKFVKKIENGVKREKTDSKSAVFTEFLRAIFRKINLKVMSNFGPSFFWFFFGFFFDC